MPRQYRYFGITTLAMNNEFDVIVLGLGGMGSAAACHLAQRGRRVLGLEQFTSPHDRGSSHGESRVIRQAYYESPVYVPLLQRAYTLWQELEQVTRSELLTLCGGLMMGPPGSEVVAGSRASAEQHGLPHEMLDAREIHRRFPPFHPPVGTVGLFEAKAGLVRPEAAVRAYLERARALGATLRFEEEVLGWKPKSTGVEVRSAQRTYDAQRLVITAGPWAAGLFAELQSALQVERQVLYWFEPKEGITAFLPDRYPIFIYDSGDGTLPYGCPAVGGPGGGVKVSLYRSPRSSLCTPESIDRSIHPEEIERMRQTIGVLVPALAESRFLRGVTCMYTNTPDKHFILDCHPNYPQVCIAAGFSGHGFKFCSVVGEIMAGLAESGATRHDIAPFRLGRLKK